MMLSTRGQQNADQLSIAWRFAQRTTYDPATNRNGMISFATAENALVQKELEDFANKVHIPSAAFRYSYCNSTSNARLAKAFVTHINDYFYPYTSVEAANIVITSAATALHDILAYSLCAPGEGILTSKPYYGRFELDFGNKAGVELVSAETDHESCFRHDVVNAFEKKLNESGMAGTKIRAVLIVNPHNPLGRCYPRETLFAILRFCARHKLHLISDEIYALSTWLNPEFPNATPFTSLLAIDLKDLIDPNLVHVTYGLSKDFGSAGLKVGALVSRNQHLNSAVQAVVRFHGVSGPSIAISVAMLEDRGWCQDFISLSHRRIVSAYEYATVQLERLKIPYFKGGNAGFFLWIDLSVHLPPEGHGQSVFERECELAQKLVEAGIFLHPREEHGMLPGWFRIVFTDSRPIIEEGFRRLGVALGL